MLSRQRSAAVIALFWLVSAACHGDFPTNPSFEQERGWTALSGGSLRFETQGAAEGKRCLALRGWALSEPAGVPMGGWLRLRLSAQPVGEVDCQAQLALAFVTSGTETPVPQLSLTAAALPGKDWRTLTLEMYAPISPDLRLALGSIGEGEWRLDGLSVTPANISPAPVPEDTPVYPDPLPPNWEPAGTLDAVQRPVLDQTELVVTVGSIEVSAPARLTEQRGIRGGLPLTLLNHSGVAKSLTISLQGPPGMRVPERTIPVRAAGTMTVKLSAQAPVLGEHWLRVELRSGDDVKALPVRLTVTPGYPTLAAVWRGQTPASESLAALRELGVGMCQVSGDIQDLQAAAQALPAGMQLAALLAPPWTTEAVDAALAAVSGRAAFTALHHPRGTQPPDNALDLSSHLAAALTAAGGAAWALSPPVDLDPPANSGDTSLAAQLGAAGLIAAPQLRLPTLRPATVRHLTVGKKPLPGALPSWTELSQRSDLSATTRALRQQAALPVLVTELCAVGSGSPELDALSLARVLVTSAYEGATGVALYARPADCPSGAEAWSLLDDSGAPRPGVAEVIAALGRELSSALPLQVFQQDDRVGLSPTAEIGYRPFLQGDQGIVAIWNNTAQTAELFVELRSTPLDQLTIEIGPAGMTRSYSPVFRFCPEAHELGVPFVPVTLQPGHMVVLSMQLMSPYVGWLGPVYYRPEHPQRRETPIEEFLRRVQESRPH